MSPRPASSMDLGSGDMKKSKLAASPRISSSTIRLPPDAHDEDRARLLQSPSATSVLLEDHDDGVCYSRACKQKVYRFYWVVIALVLLCEALLASLAVVIRQKRALEPTATPPWLPPEQKIQTIFQSDELYVGKQRPESEEAWKALMP
ncbi:hypothetical protein E4U54_003967, partial [Claviceps lovelessii]